MPIPFSFNRILPEASARTGTDNLVNTLFTKSCWPAVLGCNGEEVEATSLHPCMDTLSKLGGIDFLSDLPVAGAIETLPEEERTTCAFASALQRQSSQQPLQISSHPSLS